MSTDPVISLQQVSKKYESVQAVDALSFIVSPGEIHGFLGPNGSGKSTTLRMLMDLIQPSSGQIYLFGLPLKTHRSQIMQRVGCMIEKPDFYGYLSGLQNLRLLARARGLTLSKSSYDELLEWVGLRGREQHKVKTYSHGMKQRLGLAATLLHDPDLIILDEPNTGLDPQGIMDLRQIILRLNREQGKTILFSSHILSEVSEICSHLLVLHKGRCVVQGHVQQLLSQENLWVHLEVGDSLAADEVLAEAGWTNRIRHRQQQQFEIQLAKSEIPDLITRLSERNIPVYRIEYRNQLEDYFLRITRDAS